MEKSKISDKLPIALAVVGLILCLVFFIWFIMSETPPSPTPAPPDPLPIDPEVASWLWTIDEFNEASLIKNEYNAAGQLLYKRYYIFYKKIHNDYYLASLEEVAYERYEYLEESEEGSEYGQPTGYEFYARDLYDADYMPMKLQYEAIYRYSDGKIIGTDVYANRKLNSGVTRSYDKIFYNEDGSLAKTERYEKDTLECSLIYENGRAVRVERFGQEAVFTYDADGNMTSLTGGYYLGTEVEYTDGMPTRIVYGNSTIELSYEDGRLAETTRSSFEKSYKIKYSYNDETGERSAVGYFIESEGEPTPIFTESKKVDENGNLVYHSYKTQKADTWKETVVEFDISADGEYKKIKHLSTSSSDRSGGSSVEITFENGLVVRRETVTDDSIRNCHEYHYSDNGALLKQHETVHGGVYCYEYFPNGNLKSFERDTEYSDEYYEYIESDINYRFNRSEYSYFVYSVYTAKEVDSNGTAVYEYYDNFNKKSMKYESEDGLSVTIGEYYPNGLQKWYEYWNYKIIDGVKVEVRHQRYEYDENGTEINKG